MLNWKTRYLGSFTEMIDVLLEFQIQGEAMEVLRPWGRYGDNQMAIASYYQDGYEGYAYCLYWTTRWDKDTQTTLIELWDVCGTHCSCMGLENQWEPQRTTIKILRKGGYDWDKTNEKSMAMGELIANLESYIESEDGIEEAPYEETDE